MQNTLKTGTILTMDTAAHAVTDGQKDQFNTLVKHFDKM